MANKYGLKEFDIKNRRCYYFNDIMRIRGIDFNDISLNKKLCKKY